jgi:hypothetical protein
MYRLCWSQFTRLQILEALGSDGNSAESSCVCCSRGLGKVQRSLVSTGRFETSGMVQLGRSLAQTRNEEWQSTGRIIINSLRLVA